MLVGVAIPDISTVTLPDDDPTPDEAGQVVRGVRLGELGSVRDLTHAQRSVRERVEDPEPGRLTQTVEELLSARAERG